MKSNTQTQYSDKAIETGSISPRTVPADNAPQTVLQAEQIRLLTAPADITPQTTLQAEQILLRIASEDDVPQICRVMRSCRDALEDKTLFVCDTPEFVREHISDSGFIIVAEADDTSNHPFSSAPDGWQQHDVAEADAASKQPDSSGRRIISYLIVRFPQTAADNLGRDAGLSDSELPHVVHLESAGVLPAFRGHGLQGKMVDFAVDFLAHGSTPLLNSDTLHGKDHVLHLFATISPDNPASFLTFERRSFRVIKTTKKYGGLLRRIYYKKMSAKE